MNIIPPYDTTVKVRRRFHRGEFRLFLYFGYHAGLQRLVKSELNGRWSQTHTGWYVDDSKEMTDRIKAVCKGRAWYEFRGINEFLSVEEQALVMSGNKTKAMEVTPQRNSLGVNASSFAQFVEFLKSRGYSKSTIETYSGMIRKLANYYDKRLLEQLTLEDLQHFLSANVVDVGYSNSYHRQMVGAIKLFYRDRENLEFDVVSDILYPAKHKKLPNVLSEENVIRLLQATRNIKHKLAFAMLYSCGLRIGELIRLKLVDIDLERRTVRIRKSKGFKDRVVMLAERILPLLHHYLQLYHPVEYLLNGQNGLMYSAVSVRAALKRARIEAGIRQRVSPHTLRHSFATHLLDQGVDIRHIQVLLGHSKPETTMIYTYVANDRLREISSPLDRIAGKLPNVENAIIKLPKGGV